jgi:hypothetical protein
MKSAVLYFPYGEVYHAMEKICKRNNFHIVDSNEKKGEVNAERGSNFIGNKIMLHLKIQRTDKPVTKVFVEAELKGRMRRFIEIEKLEDKIVDSIYRHF